MKSIESCTLLGKITLTQLPTKSFIFVSPFRRVTLNIKATFPFSNTLRCRKLKKKNKTKQN